MGGQARDWITGQQEEEDGKSHSRDKRDKAITQAITCVFCRDLHKLPYTFTIKFDVAEIHLSVFVLFM